MGSTLQFLSAWSFDPLLGTGILVTAAAYLVGVHRVGRDPHSVPWPRRYTASFLIALLLAWLVLLGPVGAWDDTFFWAHMLQHITLMMLIAPLLLLGEPVLLLLRVASPSFRRRRIVPVLRSRLLGWLTRPAVGWVAFAGVLFGTHFSPFYNFALDHPLVHEYVEHPLYLGVALLYYYPLIGRYSATHRIAPAIRVLSLFAMMFPETLTGFFIYASNYVMYTFYLDVSRPFGPGPLVDQQLGGALMWGGSMIVDSVWVTVAVLEWLHSERGVAERIDLQTLRETRTVREAG